MSMGVKTSQVHDDLRGAVNEENWELLKGETRKLGLKSLAQDSADRI